MIPPLFSRYASAAFRFSLLVPLLCVLGPGCTPTATDSAARSTPTKASEADAPSALSEGETWEAVYIQGAKVGYAHVQRRRIEHEGRTLIQLEGDSRLRLSRFNETVEQSIRITSVETLDGQVLRFESEATMGPTPLTARGRIDGDRLILETTVAGRKETLSSAWSDDNGGFYATENSLARRPMIPGEERSFDCLLPVFLTTARVTLVARDFETTQLPDGSHELLRIDRATTLPDGSAMNEQLWTDRAGEILKSRMPGLDMESYRTTREIALDESEAAAALFDLGRASMVRLDQPILDAHQARRIRYRVRLTESDPAGVFVNGPGQTVKAIDAHTAELIVDAARSDRVAPVAGSDPTDADRAPSAMIQSDAPKIIEMARQAAGDQRDGLKMAQSIERYVHEVVESKNFSQAFATAAEVADSREGDCTEHAVLLAALARASGIPARVAIGLVYVESQQAFGYHMWNELYVDGRWISLDGTMGRQGIGAAHLKLAHSNLAGGSAISCFLPVAEVLGQLEIEVLEVE